MTKMKEICLVERSDYHFPHICSSLVIGDVDGDGLEEIVAGSRDGDLLVFKLTCGRPYRKCSEPLGVISAMAVGDIFNANRPTLVVICADGRLNAYQLGANSFEVSFGSSFVQLLMPNIRAAFIKDIDGDGQEELIVGLTDRVVRSYRYVVGATRDQSRLQALNKWELPLQITCIAVRGLPVENLFQLAVSQSGGQYVLITPKLSANCTTNDGTGLADTTSIRYLQSSRVKAMGEDSLFVYDNTTEIANLHHMTEVLTILPTDVSRTELIIDFPTPIFSLRVASYLRVITGPEDIRMFCACDYVGNLYIAAVGKNLPKGTDRTTQLLHFRLQSTVLMFDCAEVDNRSKVVFVWSTQSCDSLMGLSVAKEKLLIPFR